jgi:glutathione S-transferase
MIKPILVSHHLCPYVQRAAIVATEKNIAFERVDIDLGDKPEWFLAISPTGKTPLLRVRDTEGTEHILFESAPIAEYLDESASSPLLPTDPLARARHRAWVEFASATLVDIAGFYAAAEEKHYRAKATILRDRFARIEAAVEGPWFGGAAFGLVDAAFAPVFRYLDAFERLLDLDLVAGASRLDAWRRSLTDRASVRTAVTSNYPERLEAFLRTRSSYLSSLVS